MELLSYVRSIAPFIGEELRPKPWENKGVFVQSKPYFVVYMLNPMTNPTATHDLISAFMHLVQNIPSFARHLMILQACVWQNLIENVYWMV